MVGYFGIMMLTFLNRRDSERCTGISSEIGTKLRDWAVGRAGAGCYSGAVLSSNDSKTR